MFCCILLLSLDRFVDLVGRLLENERSLAHLDLLQTSETLLPLPLSRNIDFGNIQEDVFAVGRQSIQVKAFPIMLLPTFSADSRFQQLPALGSPKMFLCFAFLVRSVKDLYDLGEANSWLKTGLNSMVEDLWRLSKLRTYIILLVNAEQFSNDCLVLLEFVLHPTVDFDQFLILAKEFH
jgi:hypothetical protein